VNRAKVFCIGFHKTGTTSLYAALTKFGLRVSGTVGERWSAERLARDGAALCIEAARRFDAVEDMPWPIFFRELDAAYPGSKFVLSVRESEAWFASIDRHFGDVDAEMHRFVYGENHGRARDSKARWIEVKRAHDEAVRAHFAGRPGDFLVMDLAGGDGWGKLCPFLGVETPREPFPVANASTARLRWSYRLKKKLFEIAGQTAHPERLI
jgi:hypothetical protein